MADHPEAVKERARIVWWLRAGLDGPASANASDDYLQAVGDLAHAIEYHPERFAGAPIEGKNNG